MAKPRAAYSEEIAAEILSGLAQGHGLRAICRGAGMPTRPTVMRWLKMRPDFAARAAEARTLGGLDVPGRPALYSAPLLDEIYLRLCHGEPLRDICRDRGMPSRSTVHTWARTVPAAAHAIDLARQVAAEQEMERRCRVSGLAALLKAASPWGGG